MKPVLIAAALALALAVPGAARSDVFAVVPNGAPTLPSAERPNAPGSLVLPAEWTARTALPRDVSFHELRQLWASAGAAYGIPWQVLAAINKIETNFGRNMGPSSAGAVGWMQFMPDTWRRWGLDADGDGVADPWNPVDAIFAAARYLAAAGGAADLQRAVFAYNHAQWYVDEVLGLATLYEKGGTDVVFTLDRLQLAVDEWQAETVAANRRLIRAVAEARKIAQAEAAMVARADAARSVTEGLALRRQAVQIGLRHVAAERRVAEHRAELAAAQQGLREARERARSAAFARSARTLLSAPFYSGRYVFPVGGGPGTVSVGRDHHDYPAADIAAPTGAPVYALADALVVSSWELPSGNCGIGATIETADGQTWTYCHLSFLDPGAQPGAFLAAGDPIGLVGSTGRSTGPHLHLQLQPANAYPQDQPWFQSFAGSAFRWQGEEAEPEPTRMLAVVGERPVPVFIVLEPTVVEFTTLVLFTR
jgi:murein DD-endopeptidase MepM/ murein hydrolase activator NlpD